MRALVILVAVISMGLLALTPSTNAEDGPKITICHIPLGNPDNAHEITISINALPAHLAHGDSVGACEPECTLETDPDCFCELYPDHPDCN